MVKKIKTYFFNNQLIPWERRSTRLEASTTEPGLKREG